MPKVVVAIVAAAFSGILGFACGALLTKPNVEKTERVIQGAQSAQSQAITALDEVKAKLSNAEQEKTSLARRVATLEGENGVLSRRVWQLERENQGLIKGPN